MSQPAKPAPAKPEETEPTADAVPVPVWLVLLLGILLYWGFNYMDRRGGGFNEQVFEPFQSIAEVTSRQPYDPVRQQLAMGKDVFDHTCATCHQASGLGKEGQFPPLADSDWLNAPSPTRIGRIVLNGLSGAILVKAGGKNISMNATMAPLGEAYDDEHLAAALTYVRQQWGNKAGPVTTEQLKAIRAASAGKKGSWNPDELLAMPLTDEKGK